MGSWRSRHPSRAGRERATPDPGRLQHCQPDRERHGTAHLWLLPGVDAVHLSAVRARQPRGAATGCRSGADEPAGSPRGVAWCVRPGGRGSPGR